MGSPEPRTKAGKALLAATPGSPGKRGTLEGILAIEAEASAEPPRTLDVERLAHAYNNTRMSGDLPGVPGIPMPQWGRIAAEYAHLSGSSAPERSDAVASNSDSRLAELRTALERLVKWYDAPSPEGPTPTTLEVERWWYDHDTEQREAFDAARAALAAEGGEG